MMLDQFKCINLQKRKDIRVQSLKETIEELLNNKDYSFHVFYGNSAWFGDDASSDLINEISKKTQGNPIEIDCFSEIEDSSLLNHPGLYFISDKVFNYSNFGHSENLLRFLKTFPGFLRKVALRTEHEEKKPFILLVPPILYDFFNRADQSLLVALDNAHEYLLWADNTSKAINKAWSGNGFAGWRFDTYHQNSETEFPYSINYHEALDETLEKLKCYEKLLESDSNVIENTHQFYANKFLYALASFLPAYRYDDELISTNSRWPDEPEGPIVWKGILDLDYCQRQILIDGLLTLWPDTNNPGSYLLQPASLALMYWVIRRLQYPYSAEGTEVFMAHYFDYSKESKAPTDGRKCLGWFGGKLKNGVMQEQTEETANTSQIEKKT